MADIDFSKYADPVRPAPTDSVDFSKYADPVGTPKATGGQMGAAALEAGGRAVLEGSGVLAGAASGAAIGSTVMPGVGTVGGALVGGYLGYKSGEMAGESLGLRSPEQMPPQVRPAAYAGQAVGGSLPFAAAPFAAGAVGLRATERQIGEVGYSAASSMVGKFLNQIVNTAMRRPATTAVGEATMASSAGVSSAVSEAVAPGRSDIRANAEMLGGILNPINLTMATTRKATDMVRSAITRFSPAAQQTAAAKRLSEILAATEEDPVALARALRASGMVDQQMPLTAAQKTGSPALGALEGFLARYDKQFGAEAAERARAGMDATRGLITLLNKTGDPEALAVAAQLRQDYYRKMMTDSIAVAEREALAKSGSIAKDTPDARERLSRQAHKALSKAMDDARAVERELWNAVDGTRSVQTTNLQQTFDTIVADTLPELRGKKLPSEVKAFLERVNKPVEGGFDYDPTTMTIRDTQASAPGTNADEMRKLRSELLALARAADRDPDKAGMARVYNDLAEAVLDDLDAAFSGAGDNAYTEARTFTREFHDTFTRTLAGDALATTKTRNNKIAPELLLTKALATGKQAGALQLRELEEATRFLPQRGFADDSSYRLMMDSQERLFRLAAADSLDPLTGRASPDRIAKFIRDNRTLLNRFPEVEADLRAAVKSEDRLRTVENRAKGVETLLQKQGTFASLLGASGNNPAVRAEVARKAASRVIVAPDQEAELTRLVNVAQGGGTGRGGRITIQPKEAMDGLKASIYNEVLSKSTTKDGVLDLDAVQSYFTRPTSVGKKPLLTLLQEKGVMDAKEVQNLRALFNEASNIARSQRPGTAVDVKQSVADRAMSMFSRILGSKIASAGQAMTGSGNSASLIVHGAAARFAEETMTKMPIASVNKVLVEAMMDPEKMALLLTKVDDPQEAAFVARRIHGWFVQSALFEAYDQTEREIERATAVPEFQMLTQPR